MGLARGHLERASVETRVWNPRRMRTASVAGTPHRHHSLWNEPVRSILS